MCTEFTTAIKLLMQTLRIERKEAEVLLLKELVKQTTQETISVLRGFSANINKSMLELQTAIDSLKCGIDLSKIDPVFIEAFRDKKLNFSLADCEDLAKQCAKVKRSAGY